MKKIFLLFICLLSFTMQSQNSTLKWVKQYGPTGGTAYGNEGVSITTDSLGNVYTVGYFNTTTDFNPGVGVLNLTSAGSKDIFISKLDSSGNFIWGKSIGGTGADNPGRVTIDYSGNIVVVGSFNNTVDFDPGTGVYNLVSAGAEDIFILKLSSAGNFIAAKRIGNYGSDFAVDVEVDNVGNLVVVGGFNNTVDFDPGVGIYNLTGPGNFILKLNASGNFLWVGKIGSSTGDKLLSSEIDNNKNIYISGTFSGTKDFNPGAGVFNLTSNGSYDIFISKLDSLGNFLWAKSIGGSQADAANSLVVDNQGNIFIGGGFSGVVDFDANSGVYNMTGSSVNYSEIFILKCDTAGNFLWCKQFGIGTLGCLSSDAFGSVYAVGEVHGVCDLDPGPGVYFVSGYHDIFILKLDPIGNFKWANWLIGNSTCASAEFGDGIDIDLFGNVNVTGYFVCDVDFDASAITNTLTALGGFDAFVYKMAQPCTMAAPLNITALNNQSVCVNSSTTFTVVAPGTVTWFATPYSTNVLGVGNSFTTSTLTAGTYSFYAEDNSCTSAMSRAECTVDVSQYCRDVWPGDANSDGIANNLDILELGMHYSQTGPARSSINNTWQSFRANNWSGTNVYGKNFNHSDCNGDGIINNNDTLAIYNNYGLNHAFKTAQTSVINPQLSIIPDQPSVTKGTWGTASIYMGDATSQISLINGVAFTVDFDNTLIETNSIYIEYQNSFMDAGQNLHFRKLDFGNSTLYSASTHTTANGVTGYGKIATLHYQIKSNLTTDQVLNIGLSQGNRSSDNGVIGPLTSGTGTLMALGASVGLQELNGNIVSISPNPTNGLLMINSKTELQKIEVVSITGQVLLSEVPTNVSHTLHLDNFANGIYFINLYQNNRIVKREKVVLNK